MAEAKLEAKSVMNIEPTLTPKEEVLVEEAPSMMIDHMITAMEAIEEVEARVLALTDHVLKMPVIKMTIPALENRMEDILMTEIGPDSTIVVLPKALEAVVMMNLLERREIDLEIKKEIEIDSATEMLTEIAIVTETRVARETIDLMIDAENILTDQCVMRLAAISLLRPCVKSETERATTLLPKETQRDRNITKSHSFVNITHAMLTFESSG